MNTNPNTIAIIGMTGRFPGAGNIDEYWRNLAAGIESVSFFSDEELTASGLDAAAVRKNPSCVAARGVVKGAEWFDAAFFNISAKEAEVIDPQQRMFLEASWEALEGAGYDPARVKGYVGVFAGMGNNTYYINNLHSRPDVRGQVGKMTITLGNEKDFLATRVAYKLNFRGPALSTNTACSTSLVTICQACHALLGYQCDIALAGGISLTFPQKRAYYYQEGGIFSSDGHCRPFDAQATGTCFSDGLGIVVLKRLAEALRDGDQIHAVIRGVGLNNDGAAKVGYTAPGVRGQAEVVALALAHADVDPATISYIEAHGTATPLGDPIEIAALTQAFRAGTSRKNFCAIGSVKGNIGHVDAAAGVAGLIKTVLALKHKMLPPSLHFSQPNPKIDFADSPFFVNSKLTEWNAAPTPRRAGVSAFGIGGTNAHVVLEEAPDAGPSGPSREWQLLLLSAKSKAALDAQSANLLQHLSANPAVNLADAAFTLQEGRQVFEHRQMLVCRSVDDAVGALGARDPRRVITSVGAAGIPSVAFMFPGQGAQYVNMGAELYRTEAVFKQEVDRCSEILLTCLGLDLRQALYRSEQGTDEAEEMLAQTRVTQPALFVISYALARLWMSWGIRPQAMIGHSVGEYVAGCLAGVFSLQDALALVAGRAKLVQAQPAGSMLAVRLPETQLASLLTRELAIAAINSSTMCVVSGPTPSIEKLEADLTSQRVPTKKLQTSHAFHSAMMDPVVAPLTELLRCVRLNEPAIPYVSNVTGRWVTGPEAKDPAYWAGHVRQTVRFADGLAELAKQPGTILLEVGPGQSLSAFARQNPSWPAGNLVLSSFSPSKEHEQAAMLSALGKLWMAGVQVDWSGFYQQEKRRRIALPTYPFERKRHWVEPRRSAETAEKPASPAVAELKVAMEDSAMYDATTDDAGAEERPTPRVAQAPKPRKEKLLAALTEQFQMLYGAQAQNLPVSARFTELGLDSLMLTQASQVLQSKFGIQIAFRRLVDDLGTFADLADFLDQKLPSDFFPPEPVASLPPASTPAEGPAGTGEPSLKAIQSQLRALETQLEVLRRAAAAVAPSQDAPASAGNAAAVPSNGASREPEPRPAQPVASIGGAGTAAVDDLPLTESQMELWLACQADQDASRAFNQVFAIHLPSRVNKEGLRAILQELVNRHDALRTTFASDGSSQRIWPSREIDFQFRDVSAFGEAERELEFSKAMENEDQTPFDLVNGPLFRARLLKSTQDRYVLILAAHHIILDGWSISVLLREFSQLYNARGGGSTAGLQPAMQYRDYVRWQRSAEHGAAVEAAEAYWLDRFSTLPNDLDLPTGRPRPHVKTYRAAEKRVLLDASVYSALKQAAAAHDCTLFVFLLAGLYAWLYRLAGEDDLVIGVPVAGQLAAACHPGNTSLVGHCVNSLPIRCQCDGNAPFADHLKNTKNAVLDAHEHQSMTLRTLVRKLQLRVDPSRAPLVQVMFNLGRAARQLRVPDAHLAVPRKVFNFFDLNIEGVDSGENLQFVFRYNSDLFDDAQLARMLNQFKTLLAAAAAEPHRKVMELPLLTDAERRQILIEWNRNAAADSKSRNLHQLIEAQVERTPEGLAVVFGDQQLTYRQLEVRANQLARYLQGLGVGPDCLVGLCMKRSLEMVVGVLAILKAGGAYVPLDPELPTERLALMMEDAHAPIVLTQEDLLEKVPASNARVICLDRDRGLFEVESAETPSSGATPDNLAYVIYTSGSTGKPKGVAMIRKAVENLIGWQCESPIFSAGLRTLQFASLGFDVSFQEIFSTWSSGGTLILVPEELRRDFGGLLGFLRNQRVERLFLPFVALECLAEIANEQQLLPSSLREIITAGEQLKVTPDIGKFFEKLDGCTLQNQYGPTESHVVTAFTLTGPPGEWPTLPPIGRPISNTSVFVLDDAKQPVPIGVRGELHIGGVCLARGYLNQPKLTAERFICAPVVSEAAVRLYRTGDLARFLPDGDIEFLGRSDFQVKIRGFRIEPGEIEAVLNQNPAVQASLVVAREDAPGDKRLVAYLTRRNGAVNPSELREYLSAKLPEYMVPAAFVTLEAFPLTPNGKVDRKALPKPDFELAADNGKFVPPSTPTEIALAKIWSEVLGVKQIGQHDDFFALGGHSLQATRIVSRIHSVLHADLALRSLLENPTLESLANAIDRHFVDEMQQDELNQLLLEVESMPDEQTH